MSTGEQGRSAPQPITPAKFWLKSALVIVAVGILLAWAWTTSGPKEPVYQGKPMGEWLKVYVASEGDKVAQAESAGALRKIGTNGIPTLLRMIQASDSPLRTKLQAWADKQFFFEPNFATAEGIQRKAMFGFSILGEDAKGAVPELIALAKKPSGTTGRDWVIPALGCIGPPAKAAVPALLAIASDAKDPDRREAISALGDIHASPELVVPFLESCLRDSDMFIRYFAVTALSQFGEDAKSSVPALIALLADPAEFVRMHSTNALKRIDREAATKSGIP